MKETQGTTPTFRIRPFNPDYPDQFCGLMSFLNEFPGFLSRHGKDGKGEQTAASW